jgi:hypothetical protein
MTGGKPSHSNAAAIQAAAELATMPQVQKADGFAYYFEGYRLCAPMKPNDFNEQRRHGEAGAWIVVQHKHRKAICRAAKRVTVRVRRDRPGGVVFRASRSKRAAWASLKLKNEIPPGYAGQWFPSPRTRQ